ncbi:ADP-ribosylglycohydrolase family protein [Mycobacterium asiaticum]|uniref:ADP-ribosylglycohydrolase family protein n=1 Tax=Mycobacterium asiaticum TaxID=1790 RepID=UPI0007EEF6AA|nr:ADP-ribosylglycohydrolase family protein [Mycobacterium asiaticum]OBJ57431.1 ribosylglycohydrolase [Mycobacterium asiaticum]
MTLTAAQRDRACGVLLGTAAGDALGAGYEFGPSLAPDVPVDMIGGGLGPFKPGEWTDDTSMAIAIAEIAATGVDLRDEQAQDYIVERWHDWARTAKDVGNQTRSVLTAAGRQGISAKSAREVSAALHKRTGHTAGNGSLMRTAPVALAYLTDEDALVEAARALSDLTHHDTDAGDACLLWCCAVRHAVLTGNIDAWIGLDRLDGERRDLWASRLNEAEASPPAHFAAKNGWVVAALQAAWSAIVHTPVPVDDCAAGVFRADHLRLALETAVRGGHDTDTVAAIAGGLLGAADGASAVPSRWRLMLQGWPGLRPRGLVKLVDNIVDKGTPDDFDYTYRRFAQVRETVRHPYDEQVWIGGIAGLQNFPAGVDAIVSLCRVADWQLPAGVTHLDVRLIDNEVDNDHVDFVLLDTVRAIEHFRAEGRTVFVHCVQAHSRTPTIAALYGARKKGVDIDQALRDIETALPGATPNSDFEKALRRLHPQASGAS